MSLLEITAEIFKIELFGQYQLGLLNRVDAVKYGTYKDQVLGLGINVIFN